MTPFSYLATFRFQYNTVYNIKYDIVICDSSLSFVISTNASYYNTYMHLFQFSALLKSVDYIWDLFFCFFFFLFHFCFCFLRYTHVFCLRYIDRRYFLIEINICIKKYNRMGDFWFWFNGNAGRGSCVTLKCFSIATVLQQQNAPHSHTHIHTFIHTFIFMRTFTYIYLLMHPEK